MQEVNLIKIGSDSISNSNIKKLTSDIERQNINTGEWSFAISSWSVALARKLLWDERADKKSKSGLSTIWQTKLMNMYDSHYSGNVAQLLLDDYVNRDYVDRKIGKIDIPSKYIKFAREVAYKVLDLVHKNKDLHLLRVLEEHLRDDILAILNHNDGMSSIELSALTNQSDNDKNTVYISEIVNKYQEEIWFRIKRVIFLTNTPGILNEEWKTVYWLKKGQNNNNFNDYIKDWKSNLWTWWMWSKVSSAIKCLEYWVDEVIIANASEGLDCILNRENCTTLSWVELQEELELV